MNRFSLTVIRTIFAATVGMAIAAAQSPANITLVEGSGQLICEQCSQLGDFFLQPVAARVTDANGNPIQNYPVSWTITGTGGGYFNASAGTTTITTNTDSTGTAIATPFLPVSQFGFGTYFQQSTVLAQAGSASASFTVTNGLSDQNGNQGVFINYSQSPAVQFLGPISGTVGGTAPQFKVQVYSLGGTPAPNISVRLINLSDGTSGPSTSSASAYCQTGAGADVWSVLTDSTGVGTCTPVFGPVAGSAQVAVEVGGVPAGIWLNGSLLNPDSITYNPAAMFPQSPVPSFGLGGPVNITVKAAAVGGIQITSGNGQSGASGQTLPQALVATVTDGSGNPLIGQSVLWTLSPASAGQLNNPSAQSDSNGRVSTNLTFSSSAAGIVTVTVKSVNTPSASVSFQETAVPPITVSSLSKVSGDGQTAPENTAFTNPLVVQVAVNGGSLANVPVVFAITSGTATLTSSSSTVTSSTGQAQVSVSAGATPGSVTITATAGGSIVTFSLTVIPPPPPISATSFVNAADGKVGSISPCSLGAIVASGLNLQTGLAGLGPLQYTFNGVSIGFNSGDLGPIQSILTNTSGQTTINFQVPCDVSPGTVPVAVTANGTVTVNVPVLAASPGIYGTVMSDGKTRAVIVRPDGSFVSLTNPARRGENVIAYVTGLGAVSPSIGTNGLPIPGTPSVVQGQVIVGVNNAGVPVSNARLSEDRVGVYEVTFQIPSGAPQGNDVVFSVGLLAPGASSANYSNGSSIPIQ